MLYTTTLIVPTRACFDVHIPDNMPAPLYANTPWLPSELMLEIFEIALIEPRNATSLAFVSKRTTALLYKLLYRNVILSNPGRVESFVGVLSAGRARPGSIREHVKRVIITFVDHPPYPMITCSFIRYILHVCTGAHTFVVPGIISHSLLARSDPPQIRVVPASTTHLTLGHFKESDLLVRESLPPLQLARPLFNNLTHLRIADPWILFTPPSTVLAHLGPLPRLTHFYFAKMVGRGETDEEQFVKDVAEVLRARPALEYFIVGACLPLTGHIKKSELEVFEECVRVSTTWALVRELQKTEKRLLIVRGAFRGGWHREWSKGDHITNGAEPFDFWGETVKEGWLQRDREMLPEEVRPIGRWDWP